MVDVFNALEWKPKELSLWIDSIQYDEAERITRFYHEIDKKRSLIGHLLMKYKLGKLTDKDPSEIYIPRTDKGKPSYSNFHFNISHSGNYVTSIFSDRIIGIDIECIRSIQSYTDFTSVFTKSELDFILKTPEKSPQNFFLLWTLKESYVKSLGLGFSYGDLKRLEFTIDNDFLFSDPSDLTFHSNFDSLDTTLFSDKTPNPHITATEDGISCKTTFYSYILQNHILSISRGETPPQKL
jgi:4'-phosphopantetheinyl transferase